MMITHKAQAGHVKNAGPNIKALFQTAAFSVLRLGNLYLTQLCHLAGSRQLLSHTASIQTYFNYMTFGCGKVLQGRPVKVSLLAGRIRSVQQT